MATRREFAPGTSGQSVRKTDGGAPQSFPATVVYDENAQPVALIQAVEQLTTLALLLEKVLGEVRVIREHMEDVTDNKIQTSEVDPL